MPVCMWANCEHHACHLQVVAPQEAAAFKQCYLQKTDEQEHPDYAANDCEAYVTAMQAALRQRQCDPLTSIR